MEPLLLDRAQVAQVIVNLILNARDAVLQKSKSLSAKAGVHSMGEWTPRIEVATAVVQAARPAEDPGAMAVRLPCQRLTVSDNGVGMSEEVRAHIFEPFYTTKAPGEGTGLGLAVVWNVVKNLDGWIEIVSESDQGATFHVYFPVPDALTEVPVSSGAGVAGAMKDVSRRILLVDDNVFVADTINHLLTRAGHTITYAQNGEEALALCTDNGTDAGLFDMIVTDQNMPGMTGVELIRRVRATGMSLPVVVVSGHLGPDLIQELDTLGVAGVLRKPFSQKELAALIGRTDVSAN
jgi:CheY-like chemotaxis protein